MDPKVLIYIFSKLLKVTTLWISTAIVSSHLTGMYMDQVLVNQQTPSSLTGFVGYFVVLELLFIGFVLVGLQLFNMIALNRTDISEIMMVLGVDLVLCLLATAVIGTIVASTMQNKQFFMYKDDGLRGIRAFKEIVASIGIVFGLIPFFLVLSNGLSSIRGGVLQSGN